MRPTYTETIIRSNLQRMEDQLNQSDTLKDQEFRQQLIESTLLGASELAYQADIYINDPTEYLDLIRDIRVVVYEAETRYIEVLDIKPAGLGEYLGELYSRK